MKTDTIIRLNCSQAHPARMPGGKRAPRLQLLAVAALLGIIADPARASSVFVPGDLLVTRSVYTGTASTVTVGQTLPGGGTAIADGTYPTVFNNATVDSSFGVTSPIFIDQITTSGAPVSTLAIPTSLITTSFSSKSEMALNLSTDGSVVTFMGYVSPPSALDVSNSNTPGVVDPTNPVTSANYRAVAQIDSSGNIQVTTTNAYSGNNGRAVVMANGLYYTTGNSNNGTGTPTNVTSATGVQIVVPGHNATPATPGTNMVGNFSVTLYGYTADKAGKDNNFRGDTIFNNTLYVTKGSGSNGINTVYQVGTPGSLPNLANAASEPITILPGFPTNLARSTTSYVYHPFGIWFANATTLYVADEGDGTLANAGTDSHSGLEKWILVNATWQLAYTLQNGLNLGQAYTVAGYPTGINPATGLAWSPETDGLRNLTGQVNGDGTVSLYAVTSTVSGSGDQGADPNKLVAITDNLSFTSAGQAANEQFSTLETAAFGQVLRGVSFTPQAVPEPASLVMAATAALAGLGASWRRYRAKNAGV
jgi:hypothetical protein